MINKLLTAALLIVVFFSTAAIAQPDTLWTTILGGPGEEYFLNMFATPDGGMALLADWTVTQDSSYRGILKLDAGGDSIWTTVIDRPAEVMTRHRDAIVLAGNQYYAGYNWIVLTWIRPSGEICRTDTICQSNDFYQFTRLIDLDTLGFAILGKRGINGTDVPFIFRLSLDVDSLWLRDIESDYPIYGVSAVGLSDGGVAVASYFGTGGQSDVRLTRFDADGGLQWDRTYGGEGRCQPLEIWETNAGALKVFSHWTLDSAYVFLNIGSDGALNEVSPSFAGFSAYSGPKLISRLSDGDYILYGNRTRTDPRPWFGRGDGNGDMEWIIYYNSGDFRDIPAIAESRGGGYFLAGASANHYRGRFPNDDIWVQKIARVENLVEGKPYPASHIILTAYPNPFNSSTIIEYQLERPGFAALQIYDHSGHLVKLWIDSFACPSGRFLWDASGLPSGVYQVRISGGGFNAVESLLLVR